MKTVINNEILQTRVPSLPRAQEDRVFERDELDEVALKKIIRDLGLKVTQPRLLILKTLHSGRAHVTAQEVYEKITKVDPSIGFATVYRLLKKLTESGYATELRVGGMPARYELSPQNHHDHITCTKCGKICEFENFAIEELQGQIAKKFGFKLTGHVMELYGICTDCQRKSALR
jgi:Fur family transcriptional regulator, ferric uptake regulator